MKNRYKYAVTLAFALAMAFILNADALGSTSNYKQPDTIGLQQVPQDIKRMEKQLLGPYHDIKTLTASNIGHAYITFITNVHARQSNWSPNDWSNAEIVLFRLDKKSNSIFRMLGVSDQERIKTIRREFRELQKNQIARQ